MGHSIRIAVLGAAMALFSVSATAQTITLRAATIAPKTSIYNTAIAIPFAEYVAKLTDGKVKVEVHEGGVLAPIFKIFEAVEDGRADIAIGPASFLGGKDPTNLIIGSFPTGLGVDSIIPWFYNAGGEKLLQEHRRATMKMHTMVLGAGPSEVFAHSHKPIRTVEDLKGMKFRTLGNWAAILKDGFGAAPVVVPGSELYSMLEKKAIDAMEYSMPSENKALGFQEIAKYVIMPGIHAGSWTFEAAMQGDKWDKIPKDLQDKIHLAAKIVTFESLNSIIMQDFAALDALLGGKNEVIILDGTFKRKAKEAARKWAVDASAKAKAEGNPWPERVSKSIFDFQDRWEKYSPYLVVDHQSDFAKK
jgi:TRAP-type mannitol/chloroaromatic compound transport system substrate-binding protein